MPRILLIEDDPEIAAQIRTGLAAAGHAVDHAGDGRTALALAAEGRHSVVVVDRMLPDLDGLGILRALREVRDPRPILVLSALGTTGERVAGLRAGADDYLAKPFEMAELVARIEALIRRAPPGEAGARLVCADLSLDLEAGVAMRGERLLDLKRRELQMLRFLLERRDQVVTRAMLLEGVWNLTALPDTNVIEVHVSRLRRKLDGASDRPLIHTLRGIGYMLSDRLRP
ncbi:MAG: response regulator transcription factor [Paracoccaceae bacterium]